MADLDNDKVNDIEIGVVGSGSMGSGMTLLFSEHGSSVGCYDYDGDAVQTVLDEAKEDKNVDTSKVHGFTSLEKLFKAFGKTPRVLVLSLPHGKAVDGVLEDVLKVAEKGDIVVDGGNEWWEATERRQKRCKEAGIEWIGMGVSGGYQAARHGPSCSPGGSKEAYDKVEPLLKKWAAKTPNGDFCVEYMGPGGAGHYVKMVHNGIEHGHLSILCEIRSLLHHQLGMTNDEIATTFESWHKEGPLRGNFLIGIGYKGLRFKEGDGIKNEEGVVEGIEDKVTQDVDRSEGTGTWSTKELAERHVAAPAISAAHQLRIISANRGERLKVVKNLDVPQPSKAQNGMYGKSREEMLEVVAQAVYGCILGAFVQGLEIITKTSKVQEWNISLAACMRIWRAGCIIQSDAICEFLLPLFEPLPPSTPLNLLADIPEIAKELRKTYEPIKEVYKFAVDTDAVAPAIGATLEWLKAIGGKNLPTDFEEMELDCELRALKRSQDPWCSRRLMSWRVLMDRVDFGHHNYDLKSKAVEGAKKGKFHTEFQST